MHIVASRLERHLVTLWVQWPVGEDFVWLDGATFTYDKTQAHQPARGSANAYGSTLRYVSNNADVASLFGRPLHILTPPAPDDDRAPQYDWAQINGSTMTIAFDEELDPASVPPPSAFRVLYAPPASATTPLACASRAGF